MVAAAAGKAVFSTHAVQSGSIPVGTAAAAAVVLVDVVAVASPWVVSAGHVVLLGTEVEFETGFGSHEDSLTFATSMAVANALSDPAAHEDSQAPVEAAAAVGHGCTGFAPFRTAYSVGTVGRIADAEGAAELARESNSAARNWPGSWLAG